ncbi:thymidine kinase, cytosolic-like [Periplaneta americana]|uniref:thymidine kinase, cytosolic-like n=1 Tax=Periplaneta americana TaxID=6978 RepID=UPI0037E89F53
MENTKSRDNHSLDKGQIQVIFGPMFSGKTTELIRRLKRYQIAKYTCLIVKYANDNRYTEDDVIISHDQQSLRAVSAREIKEVKTEAFNYDVIGIDEGQFFPDIVERCEELANLGKIVIVAALDGTYQRVGFGNILNLVPLAENVVKLNAVCMVCFKDAAYTKRIGSEKKLEVIGGAEKYMAVCRKCYTLPSSVPKSPLKNVPNIQSGKSSIKSLSSKLLVEVGQT